MHRAGHHARPNRHIHGLEGEGRHVKKGEKAITLCMPVMVKKNGEQEDDVQTECFTRFIFKPHWFVVRQTDGQPLAEGALPTWNRAKALETLNVTEEPFAMLDGNCQGYAKQRTIAVSPVAAMPFKTTFHELAHRFVYFGVSGKAPDVVFNRLEAD